MNYPGKECAYFYAHYTALLLHHGGAPEEHEEIAFCKEKLEYYGFDDWGRILRLWPEAQAEYLAFCKDRNWVPIGDELEEGGHAD